jgi:hypothetical protein
MKARLRLLLLLAASISSMPCSFADIAPTQFVGSGISTMENSSIEMESAVVEIIQGSPCKLSAQFQMQNRAAEEKEVTIGFPMPTYNAPKKLTITIAGKKELAEGPKKAAGDGTPLFAEWVWYYRKHQFSPGLTKVTVESDLKASLVNGAPYRESILYCIETGGRWAGSIGNEKVVVRFPDGIQPEQLVEVVPKGGVVKGNEIHWEFVKLEPVSDAHDIRVTYIRPDVMKVLGRLREAVKKDPGGTKPALELARHLLALGHAKSNCGFPPGELTVAEFEDLKKRITSPASLKLFTGRYKKLKDGSYKEIDSEWTDERNEMIQILADAGYRDEESKIWCIKEAEEILKGLLKRDPGNQEVWNVYLANYWRFSFAAAGHWFGATRFGKGQLEAIQKASGACPDDKCIRLWKRCVETEGDEAVLEKLKAEIERRGMFKVTFPKMKDDEE